MRLASGLRERLQAWAFKAQGREPDFIIGDPGNPYMLRWYVIPRNPLFNIYLHRVVRSDDDRALHDHPWLNCSVVLMGRYIEHRIEAGGIHRRVDRVAGDVCFRRSVSAHRLEIPSGYAAVTLFLTGPRLRSWGFHCPEAGWVHWRKFTEGDRGERVGRGCGEAEE